jgi:uncharacterized membrane protein YhhN
VNVAVIATVASLAACAGLVLAEAAGREGRAARLFFKPAASIGFVVIGATALTHLDLGDQATWIIFGLVLGALGDVLLMFESLFLAGLVAFLLGHVAYIVAFAMIVPAATWPRMAPIPAMLAVSAGAAALAWLWPHVGRMRGMRAPVIAYVLVIVTMVIGAAAVAIASPWSTTHAVLVAVGAALFFASDLAVARDKFVRRSFFNRLWGLPVYYVAQVLIAWTLVVA